MQRSPSRLRACSSAPLLIILLAGSLSCSEGRNAPGPQSPTASAATTSTASEPGAAAAPRAAGGASVFVVHLVSDFDAFQKYFEDGSALRDNAGVKGYLLSRLDDGRVVIHLFADEVAKVEAALGSAQLQEHLNRKGTPDASLVWVTKDVVVSLPDSAPAGPTYSVFYKLHVADFAAFQRAFEQRRAFFTAEGVLAYGLHRSISKEALVILHFMGNSREKLEALPSRPEFAELLALASRESAEKPLIARDVARSRPD